MYTKLHFKDYNPKQIQMFPQRLDEDIEENAPPSLPSLFD